MVMEIILWILLGAFVGWIASKIMNTDAQMGAMANIIVGIIGAFLGGFVVRLLTGASPEQFSIWGILTAILGAVILLAIVKPLFGGHKAHRV